MTDPEDLGLPFGCWTLGRLRDYLNDLAVEGRYYHLEDAISERTAAGYAPGAEHFFRYTPPRTRLLCYPPQAAGLCPLGAKTYFKDFQPIQIAELPGWGCYARP